MTIAVVVKVSEGLVLAADSALVVEGELSTGDQVVQKGLLKIYNSATKVAQIREWPVGTVTFGMGQLQNRIITSHIREFADAQAQDPPASVQVVAQALLDFLRPRHEAQEGRGLLGVHVAGFGQGSFFPEEYLLKFDASGPPTMSRMLPDRDDGSPAFGATWHGASDAINRLYKGVDPRALAIIGHQSARDREQLRSLEYPIIYDAMPLQDAIDLANWLAEVTIGRYRFVVGPAIVVGPVDIAIVTREGGFEWIQQKTPGVTRGHPFIA